MDSDSGQSAKINKPLKILFIASELEDFAKTGGLADVAKALPLALKKQGHDVRIIKPFYKQTAKVDEGRFVTARLINTPSDKYEFAVREIMLQQVPVYCVDYPEFFQREGLYSDGYYGYEDNGERFAFFSVAALDISEYLSFRPDIIHCNDWHTSLVPYLLKQVPKYQSLFKHTASILTLHNAAYQGVFHYDEVPFLHHYNKDNKLLLDEEGNINFLKNGILNANKINAVSPNYAFELTTPLGSHHLFNTFQKRLADISGILNGCDYSQWNPETDVNLPANYSAHNLTGKSQCKSQLQEHFGLPVDDSIPVLGMVCRLTEQKGFGYLIPILDRMLQHNVQLVILGTGDPEIVDSLQQTAEQYPHRFSFIHDYKVKLAHLLEAGADFFLMPSVFEPCGLNQMYSLAYGTIPIVRAVGGLKDTVSDLEASEKATGFVFEKPKAEAVLGCIRRALLFYREFPEQFNAMRVNAMQSIFSWEETAENYAALYQQAAYQKK